MAINSVVCAMQAVVIWWLRRDLRLEDNRALGAALDIARAEGVRVQPVFWFDTTILDRLPRCDARVQFIHQELLALQQRLLAVGATLDVRQGRPAQDWPQVLADYAVRAVVAGRDTEPAAQRRDLDTAQALARHGVPLHLLWDHLLLPPDRIATAEGTPYRVFTPFRNAWLKALGTEDLAPAATPTAEDWLTAPARPLPSLRLLGFERSEVAFPPKAVTDNLLKAYGTQRDFPAKPSTSRLGLHLRFGTLSVRALARRAQALSAVYFSELIWRDFYQHLLFHFPHVVGRAFKPAYDRIPWQIDGEAFDRWCTGQTGFPIVDAGMRELNATGFMHNRVRMIVASFLTKHLLIDWRLGEAYFAEKLLDFELASNNGGWQWAASTGADAAPYFRIFNPSEQTKKFDPKLEYIRHWVPEFSAPQYPKPIVEHAQARMRALETYKMALAPH